MNCVQSNSLILLKYSLCYMLCEAWGVQGRPVARARVCGWKLKPGFDGGVVQTVRATRGAGGALLLLGKEVASS